MTVTIVMADAKPLCEPLPGAGEDNPSCAGMEAMANNGGEENARSTASVISYGKARIAAFGDLTWDREKDLFCPVDRIGKVDVYLATHHGTGLSGSPAAVNALAPVVAIMGNSARKGADAARMKTIKASRASRMCGNFTPPPSARMSMSDPAMIANPDRPEQGQVPRPAPADRERRQGDGDQRTQWFQQDLRSEIIMLRKILAAALLSSAFGAPALAGRRYAQDRFN